MSDKREQAFEDYKKGVKYGDIAEKYGVSINTVKTWANRYFKSKEVSKSNETFETCKDGEVNPKPRKRGGANNVKHGAYRKVFMDALFDDETELIDDIATDDIAVLEQTVIALTIRERRLMKEVKRLKEESADNSHFIFGSVMEIQGSKDGETENKTITTTEALFTALRIYEAELTKVQVQKAKLAVELKNRQTLNGGENDIVEIVLERRGGNSNENNA